jgi:hypothetical protein
MLRQRALESRGVQQFSANLTADGIEGDDFIPGTFQQIFELDGLLRAHAPALSATGTPADAVLQRPLFSVIFEAQRRGRAILHASQTSVAFMVDTKI